MSPMKLSQQVKVITVIMRDGSRFVRVVEPWVDVSDWCKKRAASFGILGIVRVEENVYEYGGEE